MLSEVDLELLAEDPKLADAVEEKAFYRAGDRPHVLDWYAAYNIPCSLIWEKEEI